MKRLVVFAVVASGCASISAMQTASTMGKGNVQGGVEGSGALIIVPDTALAQQLGVNNVNPLPMVNGFLRFGVSDNVDLGFRAGGTLLEIQTKFMFTDPSASFVVSLAPSLSGAYIPAFAGTATTMATPAAGRLTVPIPLLVGIKFGDHELVFGARLVNELEFVRPVIAPDTLITGYVFSLGAEAGFALRIGNAFIMMPELAFQAPVALTARSSLGGSASASAPGVFTVTGGVAFMFGKMKPRGAVARPPPPQEEEQWEEDKPPPGPQPVQPAPVQELPPDIAPPPPPPPPAN